MIGLQHLNGVKRSMEKAILEANTNLDKMRDIEQTESFSCVWVRLASH